MAHSIEAICKQIDLSDGQGEPPRAELVCQEGMTLSGRLTGLRVWPTRKDWRLPASGADLIYFHLESEEGQVMVPLDQIAAIRLI